MRYLIEPVKLSFHGGDADRHKIDALWLGQSLVGTAKVYNSVAHFCFLDQIKSTSKTNVRVQVGPPKEGSIFYLIYMLMSPDQFPLFPEALFELAEIFVPEFIKAMIAKKTGQDVMLEKLLDQNHQLVNAFQERDHQLIKSYQERSFLTEERLLGLVEKLAITNKGALSDMSAAVGRTVSSTIHTPSKSEPILIDEATAESLRASKDVRVGETVKIRGTLSKIDKKTGAFRLEESDTGRELTGKITDPLLQMPGNIYTHAIDSEIRIEVTAKPTIDENGAILKLFVSDAHNAQ